MNIKTIINKAKLATVVYLYAVVRKMTSWAWQREIGVCEGIAVLKALEMDDGKLDLKLQQDPAVAQWIAKCFASMVADAPNYTEMKFNLCGKYRGKWEWLTVHIQKGHGKTPHQLRQEAEMELAKLKAQLK